MVRLAELFLSNFPIALVIAGLIISMVAVQKKRKQQARQEHEGQANAQNGAWEPAVLPQEQEEDGAEFSAWNLLVDADDAPPPRPPKLEPPPVKPRPLRAAGKPMPLVREARAEPARERQRIGPFPPVIAELPPLQQAVLLAALFGPPKGLMINPAPAKESADFLD